MLGGNHFAFDMGTNSIGWAVLGLDANGQPNRIINSGVRIFSDGREPKSGTSLAEGRRVARGMARRRDRYKRRRKAVLRVLAEYGLMPDTREARRKLVAETNDRAGGVPQDVYALRARALEEKLPLHHVGRALFHLNQRRGFKSNRKTDSRDNESGKIATGIAELEKQLAGRTLGQYLYEKRGTNPQERGKVRVRPAPRVNDKGKEVEEYGFYPQRAMLEKEFEAIWAAQTEHYPDVLTEERRAHLFDVIFYQRPLKPARVGKCSFNPAELRLAKAHPLFQTFRLYKEVNELRIVTQTNSQGSPLTLEQRDLLVTLLRGQASSTYKALLGKIIKGQPDARFNKASDARDKMKGDEDAAVMSDKTRFGQKWFAMSEAEQWAVIEKLRDTADPLELNAWLETEFGFDPERRDAVANAKLPEGYGRLGETALRSMLEELKADVIPEAEAAKRAGYDHALARQGDGLDELPNYQEVLERRIPPGSGEPDDPYDIRMGRITNPTVHIALNQLRRVVNALIRKYGKPEQIAIELARDLKLSEEQKKDVNKKIAQNTREAERRGGEILDLGFENSGYNRALLRFWEDLGDQPVNRVCIYCGKAIGIETLFSGAVDIDHILPWSKTLDDSRANRILVHNTCNRLKRNFAPFEVPEWKATYPEILDRAARLHQSKRWRFSPDAWERFEGEKDFLARQLTDTQYLARLAHEYLASLYPGKSLDELADTRNRNHVRVVPGRLTEMLRRAWGLNSVLADHNQKNRNDHRHHAIDAIVVGVTTRAMLQKISHEAGRGIEVGSDDALRRFEPPWDGFREDVQAAVNRIVVSHRPDHGTLPTPDKPGSTAGQLHNDTAYGLTSEFDERGNPVVVRRKLFLSLGPKDVPFIRDDDLKARLYAATQGRSDFQAALIEFRDNDHKFKGIRRVRVTEGLKVIPIRDHAGRPYKGYKGDANYRYDVWEMPDGKWIAGVVTMFDAHRPNFDWKEIRPHPAARKVMSLQQGDMVIYNHPRDGETIGVVVKFGQNGQITLVPHNEGGDLKRRDALPSSGEEAVARGGLGLDVQPAIDPFKYFAPTAGGLKKINLRRIHVDEIGQVKVLQPRSGR